MIFAGFKFRTDILFFGNILHINILQVLISIYYGYEKED
jgi:hypothetical protein